MKKKDIDKKYYPYFEGRPNIFILFIIKSLFLLKPNGILSFILPKGFLNTIYYNKTREYIKNNFQIIDILYCDDEYMDTNQQTVMFIVQKIKETSQIDNSEFYIYLETSNIYVFGNKETKIKLNSYYENSISLNNIGFDVCVGNIVWNQQKKILTDDNTKTLLIYSSYIKDNVMKVKKFTNQEKKNYINKRGQTEPVLLINRGYGVGSYSFEYTIINENKDENIEYLIENHLIYIKPKNQIFEKDEIIKIYKKIIHSFSLTKTKEFIDLYFGNNAINTVELCHILPIYDI